MAQGKYSGSKNGSRYTNEGVPSPSAICYMLTAKVIFHRASCWRCKRYAFGTLRERITARKLTSARLAFFWLDEIAVRTIVFAFTLAAINHSLSVVESASVPTPHPSHQLPIDPIQKQVLEQK
ncbi:hypothetical protein MiSe_30410 [Microseira wollei NIES-4236]|uniref:Transposase n=1 Tax=Microseira wollei NIES-4236 TaxID=2530354 RepID=A0AAV3X8X3_9CYAN|nr:hypothetical protein MiSe_30410 [Microseira wollei NIES-4236]